MEKFLENEPSIPRLPVPPLAQSVNQMLAALKPLCSADEYDDLLQDAANCVADKHIQLIQRHLEAAAANPDVPCYLDVVSGETYPGIYGDLRGGTLPRNPYLVLEEDPFSMTINPPNQAQRAASLVNLALKFIVSMRNGTLKPDTTPRAASKMTMNCYRNLFGTTRVPAPQHLVSLRKYNEPNDLRHVVFIAENQFFSLEVLTERTASAASHELWFSDADLAAEIDLLLLRVAKIDRTSSVANGVAAITTQTHSHWDAARGELTRLCPETLRKIDDALFVVVLDVGDAPVLDLDKALAIAHGSSQLHVGTNIQVGSCTLRWYDKLQLVVTQNAVAGLVWDSALMDSTAILRFVSDIYTDLILKLARNINGAQSTLFDASVKFVSSQATRPQPIWLQFGTSPELLNIVHLAETRLADLLNQHQVVTRTLKLDCHLLSKYEIRADSFLQIAFQVANYALYGRVANSIEPISTRRFRDARTDLIAVQNDEVAGLVRLFISAADDDAKWNAFRRCCDSHRNQCREAMMGKGFERHMNAIHQVLSKPEAGRNLNETNSNSGLPPVPELATLAAEKIPLFSSATLERLVLAELLISNCGNPALKLFGIPPAVDQGFGIGYIVHSDKVVVTVASKYRQTERFVDTFESVVSQMMHVVRQESDYVLEIADTDNRKQELSRLRVQKELSNINRSLPLTRHPIDISAGLTPRPEPETPLPVAELFVEPDDYAYLGGYGYFDVGLVALRSDELSRAESYLKSPLHPSTLGSRLASRHQSSANLLLLGKKLLQASEMKQRLSMSERIRDQLSPSVTGSSVNVNEAKND